MEGQGLHPNKLHIDYIADESDLGSVSLTSSSNEDEDIEVIKGKVSSLKVVEILSNYGLTAAFPNLYLAYKSLCTLPASSATAERSFSVVIFIHILKMYTHLILYIITCYFLGETSKNKIAFYYWSIPFGKLINFKL